MGKHLNLVGQVFGSLTVTGFNGMSEDRMVRLWDCLCTCGESIVVPTKRLRNGMTKSCGCLRTTELQKRNTTHGRSKTPLYLVWQAMISRCNNPHNRAFPNYGGRGIKVCERWLKFENFLEDMGERPEGMTLDRFPDKDGDYTRSNVRWANYVEQNNNRRDNVLVILPSGDSVNFEEAARRLKVSNVTLRKHLRAGGYLGARYADSNKERK